MVEARDSITGLDVTLCDLTDCSIFLPAPLAALFVRRLTRCRLYTGPVAGATFIEGTGTELGCVGCLWRGVSLAWRVPGWKRWESGVSMPTRCGLCFGVPACCAPFCLGPTGLWLLGLRFVEDDGGTRRLGSSSVLA